jgi:hypothetical protein
MLARVKQEKQTTRIGKELSWENRDVDFEKAINASSNVVESAQIGKAYPDSNMKMTNQIQNNATISILGRSK